MLRPRIIACLLIKNGALVKTVRFGDPKYVGDPINSVKILSEKEADELLLLDIDATPLSREPNFELLRKIALECRMPLCYGGGIKTVEMAERVIGLGVEKIAISTSAVENPRLISNIARRIGNQSVAVVLDAKKDQAGDDYSVWTRNGRHNTGALVRKLAADAESLGAGEIVVNSIDNDGVMKGYDLALASIIRAATSLPITILGGAGSLEDISSLIGTCGVIGAAAGSLFVFKGPYRAVLINYPDPVRKESLVRSALPPCATARLR